MILINRFVNKYFFQPKEVRETKDAVKDVARRPNLEFKSYSTLWHDRRHFCKYIIDKARRTCNSRVACRYTNSNGNTYDSIGIID